MSIHSRHHEVEKHGGVVVASEFLDGLAAVPGAFDLILLPPQDALHHRADGIVIVHDEHTLAIVRIASLTQYDKTSCQNSSNALANANDRCDKVESMSSTPPIVTFYTRANCSLCDKAKAAIRSSGVEVVLQEIDIDGDERLRAQYTNDVPVILVDGGEAFRHSVGSEEFAAYVRSAKRTGASLLAREKCVPCRGGVPPLEGQELRDLEQQLPPRWRVVEGHHLARDYAFPDFVTALAFANRIGAVAEEEGHHPDLCVGWGRVSVTIWTHKIDGLTRSDFILAAKIEELAPD